MTKQPDPQTKQIYQAIGHYVVEFSLMVFWAELGIRQLMRTRGTEVIVAGMEASKLIDSYFSLCAYSTKWRDDDRRVVRALRAEVKKALVGRR